MVMVLIKQMLKPKFPIDNKNFKQYARSTSIKFRRAINKRKYIIC